MRGPRRYIHICTHFKLYQYGAPFAALLSRGDEVPLSSAAYRVELLLGAHDLDHDSREIWATRTTHGEKSRVFSACKALAKGTFATLLSKMRRRSEDSSS
jgi:hypothetical protein